MKSTIFIATNPAIEVGRKIINWNLPINKYKW